MAQVMSSRALAGGTTGYGTVTLRIDTIDRLRDVLTEIETAAQRARDRSRTRTRGKP